MHDVYVIIGIVALAFIVTGYKLYAKIQKSIFYTYCLASLSFVAYTSYSSYVDLTCALPIKSITGSYCGVNSVSLDHVESAKMDIDCDGVAFLQINFVRKLLFDRVVNVRFPSEGAVELKAQGSGVHVDDMGDGDYKITLSGGFSSYRLALAGAIDTHKGYVDSYFRIFDEENTYSKFNFTSKYIEFSEVSIQEYGKERFADPRDGQINMTRGIKLRLTPRRVPTVDKVVVLRVEPRGLVRVVNSVPIDNNAGWLLNIPANSIHVEYDIVPVCNDTDTQGKISISKSDVVYFENNIALCGPSVTLDFPYAALVDKDHDGQGIRLFKIKSDTSLRVRLDCPSKDDVKCEIKIRPFSLKGWASEGCADIVSKPGKFKVCTVEGTGDEYKCIDITIPAGQDHVMIPVQYIRSKGLSHIEAWTRCGKTEIKVGSQ